MKNAHTTAVAYLRTSSNANLDGDSPFRQDAAIMGYAGGNLIEVTACFWDQAVRGADPIEARDGFAALLDHCAEYGVSTVLVEDASRFARSIVAQELGIALLNKLGLRLVTASGVDLTEASDPSKVFMRQIYGVVSEYEKAKVVERLKAGRDRKIAETGRCGGKVSHADKQPELVREAKRLARRSPKTGKARSLRAISTELASLGYVSAKGTPLSPQIVANLLA